MNWDRLEGQWKQQRGKAGQYWGKVMHDELSPILGRYEELVGRLQEKYGIAQEEAQEQVGEFKKTVEELKKSNGKLMKMQKVLSKNGLTKTKMKSKASSRKKTIKRK